MLRPQRKESVWAWCWECNCLLGLGCQTDSGGMMQALPESPGLTELKAGLTQLLLQGPNSRRVQSSRERTISTDSGPALDSHEVLGLNKGLSLLLHLP